MTQEQKTRLVKIIKGEIEGTREEQILAYEIVKQAIGKEEK